MADFIFSIQPRFVEEIANKKKRFEFRKGSVDITRGDMIFIYETRPRSLIVATLNVFSVTHFETKKELFSSTLFEAYPNQKSIREYYKFWRRAVTVIGIDDYLPMKPKALNELLEMDRPPISYCKIG